MATVEWTQDGTVSGKLVATWLNLGASDVGAVVTPQSARPLAGCIQFLGTFSTGTVTLQKSNDGTTWYTVKDFGDNNIAATAAAMYEFSTSALYLRVLADANIADVTAIMVLRG